MKIEWLKLSIIQMQNLMQGEEGQDLIEYALVVALIAHAGGRGRAIRILPWPHCCPHQVFG